MSRFPRNWSGSIQDSGIADQVFRLVVRSRRDAMIGAVIMLRPGNVAIDLDQLVAGHMGGRHEVRRPRPAIFDEPVDPADIFPMIVDRVGMVARSKQIPVHPIDAAAIANLHILDGGFIEQILQRFLHRPAPLF